MMTLCIFDADRFKSIDEAVKAQDGYVVKSAPSDERESLIKRAVNFAKQQGWTNHQTAIAKE